MNTQEVWADVKGYEGYYQVSTFGNVKSLERYVKNRYGKRIVRERVLKPSAVNGGYLQVILKKLGEKRGMRVHKLVSMAFLNHTPSGHSLVVNHKDFDRQNNKLDNLEIITQRKNTDRKHLKSTSKYVGVSFYNTTNKWRAAIRINGAKKHLGYYNTEADASNAYQNELSKT